MTLHPVHFGGGPQLARVWLWGRNSGLGGLFEALGCPDFTTPVHGGWFDDPPRWGRYLAPPAEDWFGAARSPRAFKLPMVELIAAGFNTSTPLPIGLPLFALRTGGGGFGHEGWSLAGDVEDLRRGGVFPLDGYGGLWPVDFVEKDRWREALEPEVVLCTNGPGLPMLAHFTTPPHDGRDTCGFWRRIAEVHPTLPRNVTAWDEVEALT